VNRMFAPAPKITFLAPPKPAPTPNETAMKRAETEIKAAFLLLGSHPLNAPFSKWCSERGKVPTKRQARRYLQLFPKLRQAA
jgi:hypothetical protein